ncbi:S41 family peptidase [Stenotrophomonas sp. NPDC078853]|uniref:S41 family peptidase n=1 Tax=Stenotrophomonas sp. NPDC078853 TaxID=3364534 RepID=UPI0038517925
MSDGIGYISVPGLVGTDREQGDAFSAEVCQAIERRANEASRGWIVDLRRNGGGNMWPMLTGPRALLGEPSPGAFVDRAGTSSLWRIRRSEGCSSDLSSAPVAVLIGPRTASSGEAVAVAFRNRTRTRFFGRPTAGLATSNQSIRLPDASMLMLTTAAFSDRSGSTYPVGITPEVQEESDQATRNAADAWLRTMP